MDKGSRKHFFLLKIVPVGLFCASVGSCAVGLPISRPCASKPLVHVGMLVGAALFVYIPIVFLLFGKENREENRTRSRGWSCCCILMMLFLIFVAYPFLMHIEYKGRSANAAVNIALKNASNIARFYFGEFPDGVIDLEKLEEYGFVLGDGVRLVILSGEKGSFSMKAYHPDGCGRVYYLDSEGGIGYRETQKNGAD